jgi:predicted phage terminase large subunit-like protein
LRQWRADRVIIESAGTGILLIREMVRELGLGSKVIAYTPRIEKRARLEAQLAKLETANFLLPGQAPWLAEFRRECLIFPNGRNDDQVDSLAQFLDWLGWRTGLGLVRSAAQPKRRQ